MGVYLPSHPYVPGQQQDQQQQQQQQQGQQSTGSPDIDSLAKNLINIFNQTMASAQAGQMQNQGPMVYMGPDRVVRARRSNYSFTISGAKTLDEVLGMPYQWRFNEPRTYEEIRKKMLAAGLIDKQAGFDDISKQWAIVAQMAATAYAGGVKVTPFDILGALKADQKQGKGPTTTTHTEIAYTSPETARQIAEQAFADRLGRRPTASETEQFMDALKSAEHSDPTIRTTTTNEVTGNSKTVTTPSGVDASLMAREAAEDNPEYPQFQKETTYWDAFLNLLGSEF